MNGYHKKKELLIGLGFIVAAALILLNQFGFLGSISMFDLVATLFLGVILVKSILKVKFWGILFPLAFLCILYAEEWKITDFVPWPALLTAFLLSIGLSLIFKKTYFGDWGHHFHSHHGSVFNEEVVNEQDSNVVHCQTSFGEVIKYVNSDEFEKANIKCSFGDIKIYFDHALIPSGKADIHVDVSFGDVKLFIPSSWKVINDVSVFFGDLKVNNRNLGADTPVVYLHGNISFGDVDVIFI